MTTTSVFRFVLTWKLSEAPEASWCGGGRNHRKGNFRCQRLLLKQIGNRRLAYCAKHLLPMYCDLESRRNCSIIVTADEKQLASIWILIWFNISHKSSIWKGHFAALALPTYTRATGAIAPTAPVAPASLSVRLLSNNPAVYLFCCK